MSNSNWSKFVRRVTVNSPIPDIYRAWATQEGLESWFLRKAEFTKPDNTVRERNTPVEQGDSFEWLWYGYGDDAVERRKIISTNGKDFLQFTFSGDCVVSVSIKSEDGENICELIQENIPVDNNPATNLLVGCSTGWTFYLANLKSILEGGIDLRNKNANISNVINA